MEFYIHIYKDLIRITRMMQVYFAESIIQFYSTQKANEKYIGNRIN